MKHDRSMLEIRVIMNSSIEEVLSFKCCNLHDQNFEIHLRNTGTEAISVPSSCELVGEGAPFRIENLYPGGTYTLVPGEVSACYCALPDEVFARYHFIVFTDKEGRQHRAPLREPG